MNNQSARDTPGVLVLDRLIGASVEHVFAAFEDPALLRVWSAPGEIRNETVEVDFRVGGDYRRQLLFPDGSRHVLSGTYLAIERNAVLAYTYRFETIEGFPLTRVTIRFTPEPDGTRVTIRHEGLDPQASGAHDDGWRRCLVQLDTLLAGGRAQHTNPEAGARTLIALLLLSASVAVNSSAQVPARYPVPPQPMPEADEIDLARSAAPPTVSASADIYVMRGTHFVLAVRGSSGVACMVARDLHEGSRYPICFDREGARTRLPRHMLETSLRAEGRSESEVEHAVEAAFSDGRLQLPSGPTLAYMMSPRQVIFSSPHATGVKVGRWWPHLMITTVPAFTAEQLGLAPGGSGITALSFDTSDRRHPELMIKLPFWSDGTSSGRSDPE